MKPLNPFLRAPSPFYFVAVCALVCFICCTNQAIGQSSNKGLTTVKLKKLSLEELMNIEVVSVSRSAEKLTQAASAVQVITGEDIRRSGASTVPEALRLAANLQSAKANASQWAISVRGFNNVLADKLLVLIDGRTVYTPLYAGTYWDVQNVLLQDIDRIEVISGPGGTLWGANAVNGVINIITKNAGETQGVFAQAAAGNQTPWAGDVRYGGKISEKVHYRVYGTGFKEADSRLLDGSKAKDAWSIGQGGFRMDWEASQKDQLTLQGDYYHGNPNPDGATGVIAAGGNVLARWTHAYSEKSELSIQSYYDHTWRDFRNGFSERLKTYDVDAQYRFRAGKKQELIWGGNIRLMDDQMQNLELFAFLPARKTLHIYSTFIQDRITLVPLKLNITIGSKIEHNSYTGFEYSPSAHLAWTPTGRQMIWASVSRAVRTPSRIDQDFTLSIAPDFPLIVGSKFISESLVAYELGWRVQPSATVSLSLAGFYNVYDHLRSVEPGPAPTGFPITFSNGVMGHSYGAELSGTWQPKDGFRIRGGYTFMKRKLSVKPDSDDLNEGSAESNDPVNQVMLQPMFDIGRHFEAGVVFRYVDALPDPKVPSYVGLDVQLGWKITRQIQLSLIGKNLVEERHPEFIPSSPSPREIVRSICGKLTCRF